MSLQDQKPEKEDQAANPEPLQPVKQDKDPQDTDELSEEALDEASGGMLPTNAPFYVPTKSWFPKA